MCHFPPIWDTIPSKGPSWCWDKKSLKPKILILDQFCFQRKFLLQRGKYKKKIYQQKPHLNRIGRPEGGALMLCDDTRVQQEQERLLFWQQLSQWKAKDSVYHPFSTPYFLFRLWNRLLPLLMKTCIWLARVAAPECDSLLTAEKLFFFL